MCLFLDTCLSIISERIGSASSGKREASTCLGFAKIDSLAGCPCYNNCRKHDYYFTEKKLVEGYFVDVSSEFLHITIV